MTIAIKNPRLIEDWFSSYITEKLYDFDNQCWLVTISKKAKNNIDRLIKSGSIELIDIKTIL
ncbi:MAG: hypothetical protein ACRDBG_04540 [Waterburya sp.]